MSGHALTHWNAEDAAFWEREGRAIASRNLWLSIPALMLAFAVWMVWSAVVVKLPGIGFKLDTQDLFWLAALPALCGATLRVVYAFMVPIVGGRRWTVISTGLLLLPTVGIALVVQKPDTGYATLVFLGLLCGIGGGNFASSMANVNYFFPSAHKGTALGLNAGLGNLGVSLAQFVVPAVITLGLFGPLGGEPQTWTRGAEVKQIWLQNAGYIWVPLILACCLAAWFGMNDLATARVTLSQQGGIFKRKHCWIMSWLYLGTFGSFIGFSAGFPLLAQSQFPYANPLSYAWLGPLMGALLRPLGGWLADKLGGAHVALWSFAAMTAGVAGVLALLPQSGESGSFFGFLTLFMLLFAASGLGNGATFRMIPVIFMRQRLRAAAGKGSAAEERAQHEANTEAAGVLGFASAVGAFGGFFIPMSYGVSLSISGAVHAALVTFLVFYLTCIATTWWFYARPKASMPC